MVESQYKSDVKLKISDEFVFLSEGIPILRALITTDMAGSVVKAFEMFKQHFETLYLLSSDSKEIKPELKENIEKWINTSHCPLKEDEILKGIDLFYKYKSELFNLNILIA